MANALLSDVCHLIHRSNPFRGGRSRMNACRAANRSPQYRYSIISASVNIVLPCVWAQSSSNPCLAISRSRVRLDRWSLKWKRIVWIECSVSAMNRVGRHPLWSLVRQKEDGATKRGREVHLHFETGKHIGIVCLRILLTQAIHMGFEKYGIVEDVQGRAIRVQGV